MTRLDTIYSWSCDYFIRIHDLYMQITTEITVLNHMTTSNQQKLHKKISSNLLFFGSAFEQCVAGFSQQPSGRPSCQHCPSFLHYFYFPKGRAEHLLAPERQRDAALTSPHCPEHQQAPAKHTCIPLNLTLQHVESAQTGEQFIASRKISGIEDGKRVVTKH